ncbi:MAG TPA: oxidoreductase, partial [Planctomycetes bacterium]|nr:oxidoreductase [Planctomycetota bacterium]
ASLLEAVRLQRAIGSRAPSLAVAATMHHFSVSSLVDIARLRGGGGIESMLLGEIAQERLYLASAFAEGRTGASIFSSSLRVERCLDGLRVNGSKKPCTLSRSFDLLTASLLVPGVAGEPDRFAVAVIPRATPGLSVRPFWQSPILGATESDEVVLSDVLVPEMQVAYLGEPSHLDAIQLGGFLAFELLASASYLGIVSGLVERALVQGRGAPSDRVVLASELEGAAMALEGVARAADASRADEESLVAQSLLVRHHAQRAIERAGDLAVEILGGMAFIADPDVSYLLAATRALAFHPPSRRSAIAGLDAWLGGERLELS